ncbi:bifunctional 3-deoxy-7-phosphoheptulonate synthase/chorismate mutase type II [Candidatus Shikimatogenerans silvanidophilus]|uniref:bifunctional 3-deoxy-7-phosphoheptulonate synthase/chorismate mutase type II n=1 Tax=Candidatus Shikimatogenerans silvanidophilus TaxID=2782547 RepID=UPI001BA4CCCB|nr:bifunctional 3-deoxy-7-phosphoheptulonate synthase/chorismate mutase type II [Candidatus Shikimatogenerans silvanidophilus]
MKKNLLYTKSQSWIKKFNNLLIISGPCSAENEKQVLETAKRIDKKYVQVFRSGIWKPRTRPNNFEGIGEIGFNWLKKVKEKFKFLIAIEIANSKHVEIALKHNVVDIFWIGARSTVNPFTVQEIAESLSGTDKIVLVKNPINPDLELWIGSLERLINKNINNIGVIHRGFSNFGKSKYRNNPYWKIALEFKKNLPNIPIICDPSHISGNKKYIYELSKKAIIDFGFNGLMIESHCNPSKALSDANQQIIPEKVSEIVELLKIELNQEKKYKILDLFRYQIDEIDENIISLLYERSNVSKNIGKFKKRNNINIIQSKRWEKIINNFNDLKEILGYSENFKKFIDELYKIIHDNSIFIQKNIKL